MLGSVLGIILFQYFDQKNLLPKCLFHSLTGLKCPACGVKTALRYLLEFKFDKAFEHNKLIFLLLPYLSIILIYEIVQPKNNKIIKFYVIFTSSKVYFLIILVVLIYWILRNFVSI